jgi:hypothetical protein
VEVFVTDLDHRFDAALLVQSDTRPHQWDLFASDPVVWLSHG